MPEELLGLATYSASHFPSSVVVPYPGYSGRIETGREPGLAVIPNVSVDYNVAMPSQHCSLVHRPGADRYLPR